MTRKLIKFGSDWCVPCKTVDKILIELRKETDIVIEHIDIDEDDNNLVGYYNVRNIPTIIYFVDDQQVGKTVGSVSKEKILESFNV